MPPTPSPVPPPTAADRQSRIEALLQQLRPNAEQLLRQMAERLVDLPEDKAFGQIEYDLRDLAHQMAAASPQAALTAGKKRATKAPASPAPSADEMLVSKATAKRPG